MPVSNSECHLVLWISFVIHNLHCGLERSFCSRVWHLVDWLGLRSCGRAIKGHQQWRILPYWNNGFSTSRVIDFEKPTGSGEGRKPGPPPSVQHMGSQGQSRFQKGFFSKQKMLTNTRSQTKQAGRATCSKNSGQTQDSPEWDQTGGWHLGVFCVAQTCNSAVLFVRLTKFQPKLLNPTSSAHF